MDKFLDFRKQAEELIQEQSEDLRNLSSEQTQRLIHELRVHQIELELQNEELRRIQQELQESRNRYADLYDFAPVGYLTVDNNGLLVEANLTCARMLSIERKNLLKQPLARFIVNEDQDIYYLHRQKILDIKAPRSCEIRMQNKDGTQFYVDLECTPVLDEKENTAQIRIAITNITERKQAEAALQKAYDELEMRVKERTAELRRANAELTRANQLKDEFLATMSHELRTPLSVILGMSEAMQEEVYGTLNDKQLHSLRMIEESGRHLLTLINDVLDLSKIGTGNLELEITPVFVESICQAGLRFIKQLAQKKRLNVLPVLDNDVTTIDADGRRLKQILVNLLSNAVKFTPEGGKIGLEVEGDAKQQVVRFTVWDTGIGIAQEDMARLFQPFVQLDASLSRKYEGTGLGLSLVYRMVEMHGGSVSVESDVGQGSRFTVSLPWRKSGDKESGNVRDEESKTIVPHPPISRSPHPPITILLSDDNEETLKACSDYLLKEGYRVIIARNGVEAVDRTREEHPDLILMDIQMPIMNGLEAIKRIRSDKDIADIPVIALTALAMSGDKEKCLKAGANAYLSKPVSLKDLDRAIEAQMKRT